MRPKLEKEIVEKKIQHELPRVFKELQVQAHPKVFIGAYQTEEELKQLVLEAVCCLIERGFRPGSRSKLGYRFWPEKDADSINARVRSDCGPSSSSWPNFATVKISSATIWA